MFKKLILSMFIIILLTGCGQGLEQESNGDFNDINSEDAQTEIDNQVPEINTDPKTTDKDQTNKNEGTSAQLNSSGKNNNQEVLPELKVHYIDVGQADSTLFQYGSHAILFDTGDWTGNEVVNYLNSQGISTIDLVIGSHPDADHIGQLADVMNSFAVDEVWLSGNGSSSKTFQRGLEAVLNSNADYYEPRTGDEFEIGPMNLKVLNPKTITGATNEESISVLFTYGDVRFVFTGDADKAAEREMIHSGINVDADILQLGHHGSNTSSDPSFIAAVSPEVAIFSAGKDNSYGHPHPEVVSRIQNAGITLYGTDVNGTIIVTSDGRDYTIKTKKDGTVTPRNTSSEEKPDSNSSGSGKTTSSDSGTTSTSPAPSGSCVNINTATYEELQQIKHIGPERAQDLIDLRPFNAVLDLDRIKGIGPARIKDIEEQGLACTK